MLRPLFKRTMVTARAIVYLLYGPPAEKISVHKYTIPSPGPEELVLKSVAHPINPSDINQIEGVYPSRPDLTTALGTSEPSAVGGNEGLFEVIETGDKSGFSVGDWVIPNYPNYGTWRSHIAGKGSDFIKIDKALSKEAAACLSVNTCTAYEMLTKVTKLEKGDFFVQNGGNSNVGRFAIQLAKILGYKSISVVRDRPDIDALKKELKDLGADYVITEEESGSREFSKTFKEWTKDAQVKLALNCVGGKLLANLARKLSPDGVFVTYGGMSKQPVTFPTSLFIFKNLTAKGYWITKNNFSDLDSKKDLINKVVEYFKSGQLKESHAKQVTVDWEAGDEKVLQLYKDALQGSKPLMVSK